MGFFILGGSFCLGISIFFFKEKESALACIGLLGVALALFGIFYK